MELKYLRPEEVKEEWWPFFNFGQQERRGPGQIQLRILAMCPTCGKEHWALASHVRGRGQSPYCLPCSRVQAGLKRRRPLQPDEIDAQWQEFYDFARQEIHTDAGGSGRRRIWVMCPLCGRRRWQSADHIRASQSPFCLQCAQSGKLAPRWKGGHIYKQDGYVHVHLASLSPADRTLAEPMSYHNYVQEHRLVMARHLGRPLKRGEEIVHHLNGIKDDNCLENLALLARNMHHKGHGDLYYQKWQEALSEIERLKEQLRVNQGE